MRVRCGLYALYAFVTGKKGSITIFINSSLISGTGFLVSMNQLDKIISLCKRRGFVFPTSEIYGGMSSSYDYGPLGVEMLRSLRDLFWAEFVHSRDDMVGLDTQILLHPTTWIASGHVSSFTDPLVEDKVSHKRYRADHLIEAYITGHPNLKTGSHDPKTMTLDEMAKFIKTYLIKSPEGNEISEPKRFNLLFETKLGAVENTQSTLYLRGETAQGIFSNFKNVLDSTRLELPFGIAQIGKAFRNEITTGQFIFRTIELEQAEIEYFFNADEVEWQKLYEYWRETIWNFLIHKVGLKSTRLRWRRHTDIERSHYSKETYDLDFDYPFGWKELCGLAYRTNYDLSQHMKYSGASLEYVDKETGSKIIPHVIEPSIGLNRLLLSLLVNGYFEDGDRVVLKLHPQIAPITAAVFPLVANKPDLVRKARDIFNRMRQAGIKTTWDDRGNIGKRYFSQDEIGTPWCITVDYDTLSFDSVTVRDRDTKKQERVEISLLPKYIINRMIQKGVL